jgi:hypothetical protein
MEMKIKCAVCHKEIEVSDGNIDNLNTMPADPNMSSDRLNYYCDECYKNKDHNKSEPIKKGNSDEEIKLVNEYDSVQSQIKVLQEKKENIKKDTLIEEVKKHHIILKGFEAFIQLNLENQI